MQLQTVRAADKAVEQGKKIHGKISDQFNAYLSKFEELMTAWMKQKIQGKIIWLVEKAPQLAKDYLDDKDMPKIVAKAKDRLIDCFYPDIREEILWEAAVILDGRRHRGGDGAGANCVLAYLRYSAGA